MKNYKRFLMPALIVLAALLITRGVYWYGTQQAAADYFTLQVSYPKGWEVIYPDSDSFSSMIFNPDSKSAISIERAEYICTNVSFSGCVGEYGTPLNLDTTILNGEGDPRYFATLEKYFSKSYMLLEKGFTKNNTPIEFYKNSNGDIVGIFDAKTDAYSFTFRSGDIKEAKEFLANIDFKH